MPMQVILLERVDNLGNLGDLVKVKPGYARNYLIPQNKALRATDDNIAYFESQKKDLEKQNEARRKEAEKESKKLEKLMVIIIRHASEGGQLYGSVSARDIADAATAKSGMTVARSMVTLNDAFKTIGLFPVTVALHPEVKIQITVNIARSEDEAKLQEKSGKALIASEMGSSEVVKAEADVALDEVLEESGLEIEKQKADKKAKKTAEEQEKASKKAAKKAAKAEAAEEDADEAEEDSEG